MSFQASFKGPGDTIRWLNGTGAAVAVGKVQKIGKIHGVVCGTGTEDATTTVADGAVGELRISGLVYLPKKSGDTFTHGADCFWDATNNYVTSTVINGGRIGAAVIDPSDDAMPGSTAGYQSLILNAGAAGIDSARLLNAASADDAGALPILYYRNALTATAGTYTIATVTRKVRIIDWFIISRDTTASNVTLYNATDAASAAVAKGTADVTRVQGAAVITTYRDVAQGAAIKVVTSGNASVDVFVWAVPVA